MKDYVLSRQRLTFNPVTSQLCKKVSLGSDEAGLATTPSGKVGYIRVATFSKQTTDNVKTALHQLQAEGADRYGNPCFHGEVLIIWPLTPIEA